ncbi:MAG TPA: CoA-transferase [Chloroflexia bacterium]|nr:CoA-transferase [Chloroflexia bacterium]
MTFGHLGGKPVDRNGHTTDPAGGAPPPQALPLYTNPGMRPTSALELMVVAMAQQLRDGETIVFGAVSLLPLAAARLAQLTHAPNLTILAGASAAVNPRAEPLLPSSGDYGNLVAESTLSFHELLLLQAGGRYDVFFAGGLQIDARGNANLVQAGTVRGPGAAGLPLATCVQRTILYTTNHDPRTFVPRVDFVTLPGWPLAGAPSPGAPTLVVTPIAVLDFVDGQIRLVSTHGGADVAAVQAVTGFPLILPPDGVPPTPPPPPAILKQLRAIDEGSLLLTPGP